MGEFIYWLLGMVWIAVCLGLGFYVRSSSLKKTKVKFGLAAILASYLCGVVILVAALYIS
jgi:hypothetical protein